MQAGYKGQLIVRVVSGRCSQTFCFCIVLLGLVEAADVQVAVTDTVVCVGKNGCISALLQLDELLEAVLRRCIIFFVEGYVGKVIVGKGIHFRILLRGKRQVIVEVAGGLLHAVQAVIRFTPPIKGIRFGLQVILAQGDALVEIKDCPFKLRIGKVLGSQMEQDFLFGFQNAIRSMDLSAAS